MKFGVVKVNEGQVEVGMVDSRLNDFCKRTGLEGVRYLTSAGWDNEVGWMRE